MADELTIWPTHPGSSDFLMLSGVQVIEQGVSSSFFNKVLYL